MDEDAKMQARREANRMHALKSRQRSKMLSTELQQSVQQLSEEKGDLERQNAVLRAQVDVLQQQNRALLQSQQHMMVPSQQPPQAPVQQQAPTQPAQNFMGGGFPAFNNNNNGGNTMSNNGAQGAPDFSGLFPPGGQQGLGLSGLPAFAQSLGLNAGAFGGGQPFPGQAQQAPAPPPIPQLAPAPNTNDASGALAALGLPPGVDLSSLLQGQFGNNGMNPSQSSQNATSSPSATAAAPPPPPQMDQQQQNDFNATSNMSAPAQTQNTGMGGMMNMNVSGLTPQQQQLLLAIQQGQGPNLNLLNSQSSGQDGNNGGS